MAIIDSVRKLAEKVGADTNGRTIADQLNIINQKLGNTQPGSRDISDAVGYFADEYSGGGSAPETFEVTFSIPGDTESMEFRSTKTYSEIYEAITSGKKVIGSLNVGGLEITIGSASLDDYTTYDKSEGDVVIHGILFSFLGAYYNDDGVTKYMYLFMYHDDTTDKDIMKYSDQSFELPYDVICTQQTDD